ncbi:uncharacterized protein BDR25DRAFT_346126 [Lindgomyces ingoldianus]|uniref:Uncharacterized protein n=1 Tax=Lindgomyces ingoldianus TaxID=673940 RepID=A0ACB6QFB3_9PLEO|nr:uncharacterized protein BDR25DRAFT_346126 [Lindgomyces ingoldianus]KAF2465609.1 hypothetical protein BDR25DRAFT_346126 [Lindgomyces ingoldianus]
MSATPMVEDADFMVRPAVSVQEAREVWWPLMKELGWNRDYDDAATHYHVSRNGSGWLILIPRETGKPEGCVVAFTYPNGTGWVGFFIVNAAYRGNGWGRALWKALEESYNTTSTAIVGLDGVEAQVNTYRRRGFEDMARIKLMVRPSLVEKPLATARPKPGGEEQIVDIRDVDTKALAKLDLAHTGLERTALWTQDALFFRKDAFGHALLSNSHGTTKLSGFVLVRRCEHGHRFGPLYAGTYDQALLLLQTSMEAIQESKGSMIAEIFGSHPEGMKVFEEQGSQPYVLRVVVYDP